VAVEVDRVVQQDVPVAGRQVRPDVPPERGQERVPAGAWKLRLDGPARQLSEFRSGLPGPDFIPMVGCPAGLAVALTVFEPGVGRGLPPVTR
jgi:hypothetical protein